LDETESSNENTDLDETESSTKNTDLDETESSTKNTDLDKTESSSEVVEYRYRRDLLGKKIILDLSPKWMNFSERQQTT
jgi:hypothetical protein